MSLVNRCALLASVRARTSVGTPSTSAARRAATSFCTASLRRHQHLAAEMSALLSGRQLIFEVHAGRAGFDHRLHQFEGVQRSAESSFSVGDERHKPTHAVLAFGVMDLIGASESVVQAAATGWVPSPPDKGSGRDTSGRHCWRRRRPASRSRRWPSARPRPSVPPGCRSWRRGH